MPSKFGENGSDFLNELKKESELVAEENINLANMNDRVKLAMENQSILSKKANKCSMMFCLCFWEHLRRVFWLILAHPGEEQDIVT